MKNGGNTTNLKSEKRRTILGVSVFNLFYLLIILEFFYMASPFAIYFYSVYKPGLVFFSGNPALSWLSSTFLPHLIVDTKSTLINYHNHAGAILTLFGLLGFIVGAIQVYYYKLFKKGAVIGGIYNFIRHPQYVSLAISGFGILLLWPRFIVLISFITMLFVYYLLARVEEKECEGKFGESYIKYKEKTNMFLPFKTPGNLIPKLPESGIKRYSAIAVLYCFCVLSGILLASSIGNYSVDSLYAHVTKNSLYVSAARVEQKRLNSVVEVALSSKEVKDKVSSMDPQKRYLNYVLPVKWHVSEIPMSPVDGGDGHEFPKYFNRDLWKVIFTEAKINYGANVEGRDILLKTNRIVPIVEVWVDLAKNRVTDIKGLPATSRYGDMPLPLY